MHCDLEILEDLVLNKLCSSDRNIDSVNILEECISIAQKCKEKFHGNLLKTIFNQDENQVERYIHAVQSKLIYISNVLFRFTYRDDENAGHSKQPLNHLKAQESVYHILIGMITILEKEFNHYFNHNYKIPEKQKLDVILHFHKKITSLKEHLNNIDNKLLTIIFLPFQEIICEKHTQVTYNQLNYLNIILEELLTLQIPIESTEKTGILKQTLINYNFNSWRYFQYLAEEIIISVKQEETWSEQLLKYYYHLKCIKQTYSQSEKCLCPATKPITEQLITWLSEEIYYFEKQVQVINTPEKKNDEDFKIQTTLSLPQLAYLIKLFVKTGIITNKPIAGLLNFLSNHIQTKKSKDLTTLHKRYYEIDDSSRNVVKSLIIKILNAINED